MSLKSVFLKLRNNYVVRQVNKMKFSDFSDSDKIRKRIIFSGKVQNIGFRYESQLIAGRLGLTGTACNMSDGSVIVELQGSRERIDAFIRAINSVARFRITKSEQISIPFQESENSFEIVR